VDAGLLGTWLKLKGWPCTAFGTGWALSIGRKLPFKIMVGIHRFISSLHIMITFSFEETVKGIKREYTGGYIFLSSSFKRYSLFADKITSKL
jgi:hypothetical protein